ncbi:MAG: hypothetical protein ABR508_03240 [Candidatus Baltobacteraceae bacterium]
MDAAALSTALASSAANQQVAVSVVRAVDDLDRNVAAELFSSIGLGAAVDIRA